MKRSISAYRSEWLPELILLLGLSVLTIVLFSATDLDLTAARWFYLPAGRDHWAISKQMPWSILYHAAPWITGSLALAGLAGLAFAYRTRSGTMRRHSIFLLLALIIGPGLVVNAILKDHWQRPRPREIVEFGGTRNYSRPLLIGEGGKSFPCGHCSVAFLCAAGWWIWKRRRRAWALTSLATGLLFGFASGLGRMAAGGHFLSDIIWAGLTVFGIAHVLYYYVLRIPAYENPGEIAPDVQLSAP